jgi:hypothetical protein
MFKNKFIKTLTILGFGPCFYKYISKVGSGNMADDVKVYVAKVTPYLVLVCFRKLDQQIVV